MFERIAGKTLVSTLFAVGLATTAAAADGGGDGASNARTEPVAAQSNGPSVIATRGLISYGADARDELEAPEPLTDADATLYTKIFEYQHDGEWRKADRLIKKLGNRLLMGHVLFQRYMHPTKYRSKFSELRNWLKKYADHPEAARIYRLAVRRKPSGATHPRRPVGQELTGSGGNIWQADKRYKSPRAKTAKQRRAARSYRINVSRRLSRGWPTGAMRLMEQKNARRAMDQVERDKLYARIAQSYLLYDKNAKAFRVAAGAGKRSGKHVPFAHFIAGLAAWRMDRYADAVGEFEKAAYSPAASGWTAAAGAYWASRANTKVGRFDRVSRWLRRAAKFPRTFYGQLAVSALGADAAIDMKEPPLDQDQLQAILKLSHGKRALALLQVGEDQRAELELRKLYARATPEMRDAMMGLAVRTGMPALAMRLASLRLSEDGDLIDAALWPLPHWEPRTGFTIDRALIYALMRQEWAFKPRARSRVGARGLMQVMPRTARNVARANNFRGVNRKTMYDPELNMMVGQAYVEHLLENRYIENTLVHVVTAYNAGPGNVQRWAKADRHEGDPLMFMELVTYRETRAYAKKVLTNFWMYRQRLGQEAPSRDALASHTFPDYVPLDKRSPNIAATDY